MSRNAGGRNGVQREHGSRTPWSTTPDRGDRDVWWDSHQEAAESAEEAALSSDSCAPMFELIDTDSTVMLRGAPAAAGGPSGPVRKFGRVRVPPVSWVAGEFAA